MAKEKDLQVQEAQKQEVVETDAERIRARKAFVPRADIYETGDEIVIIADMPGVDENSVDITLEKNVLTINGYVEPYQFEGYNHTVNSHINRLRNKIEKDPANPRFIKTVWGYGYRFVETGELA